MVILGSPNPYSLIHKTQEPQRCADHDQICEHANLSHLQLLKMDKLGSGNSVSSFRNDGGDPAFYEPKALNSGASGGEEQI